MNGLIRRGRCALALGIGLMVLAGSARAHADASDDVAARRAAVAEALRAALAGTERLVPLPAAISDVRVHPMADPVFLMRARGATADVVERTFFDEDPSGFRLVVHGRILGFAPDGTCAVRTLSEPYAVCFAGPGGERRWTWGDETHTGINAARWLHDRWVIETHDGLIDLDGALYPPELAALRDRAGELGSVDVARLGELLELQALMSRATERRSMREAGILFDEPSSLRQEPDAQLTIAHFGDRTTIEHLPSSANDAHAVWQLDDGRWISFGHRMVIMDPARPRVPRDADAAAFAAAFEQRDTPAIMERLEAMTSYPRALQPKLTRNSVSTVEGASEFSRLTQYRASMRHELERLARVPTVVENDELRAIVEQLTAALEQNERDLTAVFDTTALRAVHRVLIRLQNHQQYFDGRWIANVRFVTERADGSALLTLHSHDPADPDALTRTAPWLASLDGRGQLELIAPFDVDPKDFPAGAGSVPLPDGRYAVHLHDVGLFAIDAANEIEWLDRTPDIRAMQALRGIDRAGRLYFSRGISSDAAYWVYTLETAPTPRAPKIVRARYRHAVIDDAHQLWYVDPTMPKADAPVGLDGVPRFEQTRDMALMWHGTSGVAKTRFDETAGTLYGVRDGVAWRYFEATRLAKSSLVPGREGTLFVIEPRRGRTLAAFLVHGSNVTRFNDLHAAALAQDPLLERYAPRGVRGVGRHLDERLRPAVSSTTLGWQGDVLWVGTHNQVEAYRDGVAMEVTNRIELMDRRTRPTILGTTIAGDGTERMLLGAHGAVPGSLTRLYWVTATDDGLRIERMRAPEALLQRAPAPGDERPVWTSPQEPMLAPTWRAVYFNGTLRHRGFIAATAPDASTYRAGVQEFVAETPQGWRVLRRNDSSFPECTIERPDGTVTIPGSGVEQLEYAAAPQSDRVLMASRREPIWFDLAASGAERRALPALPAGFEITEYIGMLEDGSLVFGATTPRTGEWGKAQSFLCVWPAN